MSRKTVYLYINGLSNGAVSTKDRIAKWWWRRGDLQLEMFEVDWYRYSLDELERQVLVRVNELLWTYEHVVLIGVSAGGSLALNVFVQIAEQDVVLVLAHARLKSGNYPANSRMSLGRRAKIGTNHESLAFRDSVEKAESKSTPLLSGEMKNKILNLVQLTDCVVAPRLMQLADVKTHHSFAFGHFGGYIAHMFADRNIIRDFVNKSVKTR